MGEKQLTFPRKSAENSLPKRFYGGEGRDKEILEISCLSVRGT